MARNLRSFAQRPEDPTWVYPYASRVYMEKLKHYFSTVRLHPRGWHRNPKTHALPQGLKATEPWPSVRPDLRPKVQAWYDRKVAEWIASGRPLTPGKMRSLRCNAAYYGRAILTGRAFAGYSRYQKRKKDWERYQSWRCEQERREFSRSLGPTQSRLLPTGWGPLL